jgi:hypothetical protein
VEEAAPSKRTAKQVAEVKHSTHSAFGPVSFHPSSQIPDPDRAWGSLCLDDQQHVFSTTSLDTFSGRAPPLPA